MTKQDVWKLFEKTGKIEYFIKYHEMVEGEIDKLGDQRS